MDLLERLHRFSRGLRRILEVAPALGTLRECDFAHAEFPQRPGATSDLDPLRDESTLAPVGELLHEHSFGAEELCGLVGGGTIEEGASLANKLEPGLGTRAPAPKLCKADQRLHRDVRVAGGQRARSRLNEQRFGANDVGSDGAPHAHAGVRRRGILRYLRLLTNDLLVERVGALVLIAKVGESGASEQHSAIVRIASPDRVPLALKSRFGGRLHRALGSANDAPRVSGRGAGAVSANARSSGSTPLRYPATAYRRQESRADGFASSGCSNGLFTDCAQTVARNTLLSTRAGTSWR